MPITYTTSIDELHRRTLMFGTVPDLIKIRSAEPGAGDILFEAVVEMQT